MKGSRAATLVLVFLAALLLGAHFLRGGHLVAAGLSVLLPVLALKKTRVATILVRAGLTLGALEWIRTLLVLVDVRRAEGLPFLRLTLILGAVAALTMAAALFVPRDSTDARTA